MLAIAMEYLNGWAMATDYDNRQRAEWPPHPDRVFMALASAFFETGEDSAERAALKWLETLDPPTIVAARERRRTTAVTFVPVNDVADPVKNNKALMPAGALAIGRVRQPRTFPVAMPYDPLVLLEWGAADPTAEERETLAGLCAKVTHIGHSASLVQMWICNDPGAIAAQGTRRLRFEPEADGGQLRLRIFGKGRLEDLEAQYNKAAVEEYARLQLEMTDAKAARKKEVKAELGTHFPAGQPRSLRPQSSMWTGYQTTKSPTTVVPAQSTVFSPDLLVLKQTERMKFGLESTLLLTAALRDALMKHCRLQPPPEWLCGHPSQGGASKREGGHLAILPMADVGHPFAQGRLLGLALALPRNVTGREIAQGLHPALFDESGAPRPLHLYLGRIGDCMLQLDEVQDYRVSLDPSVWTAVDRPSKRWATVTPIALDRHVREDDPWEAIAEIVSASCERIGLPRPAQVVPSPVSMFRGAAANRDMPRMERKSDGGRVRQTHAIIAFTEAVIGPVLLGAGRFRGYGLCRPLTDEDLR